MVNDTIQNYQLEYQHNTDLLEICVNGATIELIKIKNSVPRVGITQWNEVFLLEENIEEWSKNLEIDTNSEEYKKEENELQEELEERKKLEQSPETKKKWKT